MIHHFQRAFSCQKLSLTSESTFKLRQVFFLTEKNTFDNENELTAYYQEIIRTH